MTYLWNKDHGDYQNMHKRNAAFEELLQIYKEADDQATMKTFKKKIENLRTNYLREVKKVGVRQYMF